MIDEFNKFVGNKILGWFLSNPTTAVNMNELARELEVSPGSVKKFSDMFCREHILNMEKIGTVHIFTFNNSELFGERAKKDFYDVEVVGK